MGNVVEFKPRGRDCLSVRLEAAALTIPPAMSKLSPFAIAKDWEFTHLGEPILHYLLAGPGKLGQLRVCLEAALAHDFNLRFESAKRQPTIEIATIAVAYGLTDNIRSALTEVLYAALAPGRDIRRIKIMSAACAVEMEMKRIENRGAPAPTGRLAEGVSVGASKEPA